MCRASGGSPRSWTILRELSLTRMTQHVLVNFADRRSGLTVKDVEAVIGTGVDVVLPRSKAVPLSTNRGVPLLQSGGRDAVAKQLHRLVARFQPQLKKSTGHEAAASGVGTMNLSERLQAASGSARPHPPPAAAWTNRPTSSRRTDRDAPHAPAGRAPFRRSMRWAH